MTEDKQLRIRNSTVEFLIFTSQAGEQSIEARFEDETVWLTQKLMAELFQVSIQNVSQHLVAIFGSGELDEESVIKKFLITAADGKAYLTQHYNLDAIIAVGYRVNSRRATQFRQWATQVLRDFAIRGWVLDKQRLENGGFLGKDYFEELLVEIREIRLSERRFYQKVTDIYATAIDYNREAPTTRAFFASVQNKLHFGATGHTAAEIIDLWQAGHLQGPGRVSMETAQQHALTEFERYRVIQDRVYLSDFDKTLADRGPTAGSEVVGDPDGDDLDALLRVGCDLGEGGVGRDP
jgi:hypothetical protein